MSSAIIQIHVNSWQASSIRLSITIANSGRSSELIPDIFLSPHWTLQSLQPHTSQVSHCLHTHASLSSLNTKLSLSASYHVFFHIIKDSATLWQIDLLYNSPSSTIQILFEALDIVCRYIWMDMQDKAGYKKCVSWYWYWLPVPACHCFHYCWNY